MTHAFDAERKTFTQAYGSTVLDASLLLIPRVGFLPATDPRVMGTINAVRRELSDGGLVKRYQTTETNDGLKGVAVLADQLIQRFLPAGCEGRKLAACSRASLAADPAAHRQLRHP